MVTANPSERFRRRLGETDVNVDKAHRFSSASEGLGEEREGVSITLFHTYHPEKFPRAEAPPKNSIQMITLIARSCLHE